MKRTVFITGPSGIGKSPLDNAFQNSVYRIDPYRLRDKPRHSEDYFYGHKNLKEDFELIFKLHDEKNEIPSTKEFWYSKSKLSIFNVRGTWQILPLGGYSKQSFTLSKAEIFAPALAELFQADSFRTLFGEIIVIVLNPINISFSEKGFPLENLIPAIKNSLKKRGENNDEIEERTRFEEIKEEVKAWNKIMQLQKIKVFEFLNWKYAEWQYLLPTKLALNNILEHQIDTLIKAKEEILENTDGVLYGFLKSNEELRRINEIFVKHSD